MNISLILGTARKDRLSKIAFEITQSFLKTKDLDLNIIDIEEYLNDRTIPAWIKNTKVDSIKANLAESDAYIIVSPEYNRSYPGELKIFLDAIGEEVSRKPVGLCGVSSGETGGARMVEQLHNVLIAKKMVCIRNTVYFNFIEEEGYADPQIQKFHKRIDGMLEELLWYANALKSARNLD